MLCFNYYCWKLLVLYNVHVEASAGVLSISVLAGLIWQKDQYNIHLPSLPLVDGKIFCFLSCLNFCVCLVITSYPMHSLGNIYGWTKQASCSVEVFVTIPKIEIQTVGIYCIQTWPKSQLCHRPVWIIRTWFLIGVWYTCKTYFCIKLLNRLVGYSKYAWSWPVAQYHSLYPSHE